MSPPSTPFWDGNYFEKEKRKKRKIKVILGLQKKLAF